MAFRKRKKPPVQPATVPERQPAPNTPPGYVHSNWDSVPDRLTDASVQTVGDVQPGLSAPAYTQPGETTSGVETPAQAFIAAVRANDKSAIKATYANLPRSGPAGIAAAYEIKDAFFNGSDADRAMFKANVTANKDVFPAKNFADFQTMMSMPSGAVETGMRWMIGPRPKEAKPAAGAVGLEGGAAGAQIAAISGGGSVARLQATPGRHPDVAHVDPRLVDVVSAGASHLPAGYKVTINEGYNPGGHVANSQHHVAGKGALDVQIWTPGGQPIPNSGADPTGMYHALARASYGEMLARHPELKGQFAWGGAFGKSAKDATPDLMHFDIGGERGAPSKLMSRMGALPGVTYGAAPVAAAAPAKPAPVAGDLELPAGTDMASLPAGMRNNNPGNLMYVPGGYLVKGPSTNYDTGTGGVGKFHQAVYGSALDGMTAAARLAVAKFDSGKTTIRDLIAGKNGWTPGYTPGAEGVAKAAGLGVDQKLNLHDPAQLQAFLRGLVTQEHGPSSKLYSDALIQAAVARQFGASAPMIAGGATQDVVAGAAGSRGSGNILADAVRAGGLRKGSPNTEANRALQASLVNLGVGDRIGAPLAVDGRFGNRTKEAVRNYQARVGITPDGVFGADTLAHMNADFHEMNFGVHVGAEGSPEMPGSRMAETAANNNPTRAIYPTNVGAGIMVGAGVGDRSFAAGAAAASIAVNPKVQAALSPSGSATLRAALEHPNEDFATERGWDPAAARIAGTLRTIAGDTAAADAMKTAGKTEFIKPVEADAGVVIPKSFEEWLGGGPGKGQGREFQPPEDNSLEHWLSAPTAQSNGAGEGMFGNVTSASSDPYRPSGGSSSSGYFNPGGSGSFDDFASGMSSAYQSAASGGGTFGGETGGGSGTVYSGFTPTPKTVTSPTTGTPLGSNGMFGSGV